MQVSYVHIIEASATGTLSMASMLANSQASSGCSVNVVYSVRQETPESLKYYFDSAVNLYFIDMDSWVGKIKSFLLLRKYLKALGSDVVILHSSYAGFIGRISTLFLNPNPQLFYIPHCISFMRQDIGLIKKLLFVALEWTAAIKRCTYLACSESERKIIQAYIPFRQCELVENAVEMPSTAMGDKARQRIVITVGGIRLQKGPREYAAIARLFSANMTDVEFVWVGDGDAKLKKILVDAGVKVTGWLDRGEVCEQLSIASVYLSTSHWEGMPVSVIEAMYSRLPVVATRCAGNIDVVKHEDNGWLFDQPSEACEQIAALFSVDGLSTRIAERAYSDAYARFTPEKYFQAMTDIMQTAFPDTDKGQVTGGFKK